MSRGTQTTPDVAAFLETIPHLHGNERRRALAKWKRINIPSWRDRVNRAGRKHREKETTRQKYREWEQKYKQKPEVRIKKALRRRLQNAVECQKTKRRFATRETMGCSPAFLRQYLESKFRPGMSWDNYGTRWEIDHIIPISKFNLADPEEQKRVNHFTNLRPLWKFVNQRKRDNMINPQMGLQLVA